ncbi:MAG: hypothetical protein JKY48_05995 [Flavobacteriales bacterium]|nr:hypothetical protein [Flavobacteriales bacterium]
MEKDHYEFYLYKVAGNTLFCEAIAEDRVTSLNSYKYQKEYNDNNQSASFRASIVHVKPIPVKAGDAIYLEVLATKGSDCGHIFDCRTSEGSLVTKVINDNCDSIIPINIDRSLLIGERREAVALRYLSDLFCIERKAAIAFTSINLLGKDKTVRQQNDFLHYSKKESPNYQQFQNLPSDTTSIEKPTEIVVATPISIFDQVLKERSRIADSMKLIDSKGVKSTAELNHLTELTKHHTIYDVNGKKKATRLQVDRSLFSLLLTDLQSKRNLKREELRLCYIQFKKLNKKELSKRKKGSQKLKQLKIEKKAIEAKITTTRSKIKRIKRLISKKEYALQDNFVFNKSTSIESEGVIYKIQIGVYKNKISPEVFRGLSPVSEDPYEGNVRYSVGAFPKFNYAKQAKAHVVEIGLKDAFIVAYYREKRIEIKDALKLEP